MSMFAPSSGESRSHDDVIALGGNERVVVYRKKQMLLSVHTSVIEIMTKSYPYSLGSIIL